MKLRGYLFILMATVLWGIIGPVAKVAFAADVTPMETAFWRAALAWLFFAAHALRTGETRIRRADCVPLILFAVFCVTIFYGSYQLAVRDVGAALASVLLYTAPAWVAFLSWLLLREAMDFTKIAALSLTMTGVVCICLGPRLFGDAGTFHGTFLGVAWGLTSGLTYALCYIFGKGYLSHYSTPTIFLYALPIGALGLLPFVEFHHKTPAAWASLFTLAFLSTYGAYMVYYAGLRHLEATRAAVVANMEPVIAAVLAYVWWGERFGATGYAGSALIISSVLLMVLLERAGTTRAVPENAPDEPSEETAANAGKAPEKEEGVSRATGSGRA